MNRSFAAWLWGTLVVAALLTGCRDSSDPSVQESGMIGGGGTEQSDLRWRGTVVPRGTEFDVRLTSTVSTHDSRIGDEWDGVLTHPVTVRGQTMVDEGAVVHGTVRRADPPSGGDRATLELAVTSVEQDGRILDVSATTEPIIAGTSRAKHIGAIAGGAAAGAILGKVVSGSNKGAVVGGVLGGVAGHVLTSRHSHVELRPGTELSFLVNEQVALR
jgi:hypothetical protein